MVEVYVDSVMEYSRRRKKAGMKQFLTVINGFEVRLTLANTGIPIKAIYDVEKQFQKY